LVTIDNLGKLVDHAVDLALLLPPLDDIQAWGIPPAAPMIAFLGQISILVLLLVRRSVSSVIAKTGIPATVAALAITGLAILGVIGAGGSLDSLIAFSGTTWFALVLAIRLAEGLLSEQFYEVGLSSASL